jgi:hypothetical protein
VGAIVTAWLVVPASARSVSTYHRLVRERNLSVQPHTGRFLAAVLARRAIDGQVFV